MNKTIHLAFVLAAIFTASLPYASACSDSDVSIEQIQGRGDRSPMQGREVTINAVVTAAFQQKNELQGFFVQQPDEDPKASHGLFVYASIPVEVNEQLVIKGRVKEFHGLTELVNVKLVKRCGRAKPITPLVINYSLTDEQREALEGVLVTTSSAKIAPSDELFRYGQLSINPSWPDAQSSENWIVDDASTATNPTTIPYLANLKSFHQLIPGSEINSITGIVSFAFGDYRLIPTKALIFADVKTLKVAEKPSMRLVSFNSQNLFNGDGNGRNFLANRGAKNQQQWQQQLAKVVAALAQINADVVVLNEVENDGYGKTSAIIELLNPLNAKTKKTYTAVEFSVAQRGNAAIHNVILYNTKRIEPLGNERSILQFSGWQDQFHRPYLMQLFRDKITEQNFTIVAAHLKSKAGHCPSDNSQLKRIWGACSVERRQAIVALNDWLQSFAVEQPVFLLGDLNALPSEPAIEQLAKTGWQTPFQLQQQWSYVYQGQRNLLDYIWFKGLANKSVAYAHYWPINAGIRLPEVGQSWPLELQDIERPLYIGSSDHNPVIIDVQFE